MWTILFNNPIAVIIFFVALIWMIIFAVKDHRSLKDGNHIDMKSVIVSTGVLGTFIGIAIGLWEFNTEKISESVPELLEGLKLAFATSIAGMSISIFLSTIQKNKITGGDDELSILGQINDKLSGIAKTNEQVESLRLELGDRQKNTQLLIEESNNAIAKLATQKIIADLWKQLGKELLRNREFVETQFTATNKTLKQAIEMLSRGATEEIIKALENVISDFNQNLVDQFGDNFKQLNQAVVNLVKWQEQYKVIIERDHGLLVEVRNSLESSGNTLEKISSRNEEVQQVYEQLKSLINVYDKQVTTLNKQMQEFSSMGIKATEAFDVLSTGFEKFKTGMEGQSETVSRLTQDIAQKLPESLGKLENTLTGLTTQFGEDYKGFLDSYRKLIP